jgi:SRSO17 transposase
VGVQRQYTGTAGRVENAQVAVYLTYAAPKGYAFIDRALYLPKSWTSDADRCAAAGVPEDVQFATKPAQATAMIIRALDAGTPARWAAGDEVYGADPGLRKELVGRRIGYVLAIAKDHPITTGIGPRRADELASRLPKRAWQRLSAGNGAKGERFYDWALIDTIDTAADSQTTARHWLLIRRNRRTGELAYYRAHCPTPTRLAALVKVAGTRWQIEESFQSGKELTGLDEHQVRRWTSWHRWTVLAMLAHAFLSVMTATAPPPEPDAGLIPLTRNEIRRLFTAATSTATHATHTLRWSTWRRRHQARARTSHYQRQAATLT